jgi:triosephosphate isomerase
MARIKLIAANWKMYKTPQQTRDFFGSFLPLVSGHERDEILVCPPFVCLPAAVEPARGSRVAIGGQNLHWEKEGPYTGEISAAMLLAVGCSHVIIGHSERRQAGESDDIVNRKLRTALEADLTPILCVGEVLEEREATMTEDVLRRQCVRAFHAVSTKRAAKLVIAYEPVWAIGTGLTPTPKDVAEMHGAIRTLLGEIYGPGGSKLRILYGGSVKPGNCRDLLTLDNVDGALIGGASLKAAEFLAIAAAYR